MNAMAALRPFPEMTPQSLLRQLQIIETEFGRQRSGNLNEPRALDLDLIAFGDRTINEAGLVLPHPRAHRRRFVLAPLAEIAPEFILPGQSNSARTLLDGLPTMEGAVKLE
jgi:2-amino-4-hydroxy-6-hydroxymethyldihydropteridine diphosphokinase